MGGLGLITAGFLAAGAALAAVPIVIHLLFRRKAPRVNLGSLRFLRIAIRDNAHRRKIRRWLLLALRVAGVLLLALLFARPYFSEPEVPGREREVAIMIDRSASMAVRSSGGSAYTKAIAAASKLLAGLPDGTAVHLAFFDESGVELVPSGKLDDAAKKPGSAGTDFAKAIAWARDLVVQSRRKLRQVYLFTDLQRAGLDRPSPDEFPQGIQVEVVDVGRTLQGNLAILDARAVRTDLRPGSPLLVSSIISNFGSFPVRNVEVRLTLEGGGETFRLSEKITLDASSRREVRFSPAIRRAGLYRGSVEVLHDDELPFDNSRWLAFDARVPDPVLLVDGNPGATAFAHETYYLEAALRLRLPQAGPSATPFEPQRLAWDGGATWPLLAGIRVVILANVPEVPSNVVESLRSFVAGGGRLVIFAGNRLKPGSLGSLRDVGLLPAEVEGTLNGLFRFVSWKQDHPILEPFTDPQHGDLRSLVFLRLAGLKPLAGSVVLASTNEGHPFLVESTLGKGRIVQWACPADNDWGDWTVQRLYLPLIHLMMGYLTDRLPGTGPVRDLPVGSKDTSGIETVGGGLIVRNSDPAESRIERASPSEFRSVLRLPDAVAKPEQSEEARVIATQAGVMKPGEFWKPVAWVLLIVLVAETFLANRTYA